MAERRMFAKSIIDSDLFIDMPATARLLYFDLAMRADDDGFVGSPKKIMRMTGATAEDMQLLVDNQYIIPFESGIIVIRHWRIHNVIQKDRYKPTVYQEEKNHLSQQKNKAYTLLDTECIQDVSNTETQVRLGKDRLGKDRLGECEAVGALREGADTHTNTPTKEDVIDYHNEVCRSRGVSPTARHKLDDFIKRFLMCHHKDWKHDMETWVDDDIVKGAYTPTAVPGRTAGSICNFTQSGTDWNAVADQVIAAQNQEDESDDNELDFV